MELCGGFVGCMPGWMLVNPGEIGLAFNAQYSSPLAFLPSGFLAFRSCLGKHRNIPSGETALFGRNLPWRRRRVDEIGGQLRISRLRILHRVPLNRPVAADSFR